MNSYLSQALVVFFVILLVFEGTLALARLVMRHKIAAMFDAGDLKALFAYAGRPVTQFVLGSYAATSAQLNACLKGGDEKSAHELFTALLALRLPRRQRLDVLLRAFDFWLREGMGCAAQDLLKEIDEIAPQKVAEGCRQSFDIIARHSHAYLKPMKEEFQTSRGMRQLQLAFLISTQYKNLGDTASGMAWQERFERLARSLTETDATMPAGTTLP